MEPESSGFRLLRDSDILKTMEFETPEEELVKCPLCGLQVPESQLETCSICSQLHCEYCSKLDFGRVFCGVRCRGFFFWGDGDQDEKDY